MSSSSFLSQGPTQRASSAAWQSLKWHSGETEGCKQVETVPVMAISIPLGQPQLWMRSGVTSHREEKAGGGGGGSRRGLNSLSQAQPTFYKNLLQNKTIPVSGWVAMVSV